MDSYKVSELCWNSPLYKRGDWAELASAKTSGAVTSEREKNWPIADRRYRRFPSSDPISAPVLFSFLKMRMCVLKSAGKYEGSARREKSATGASVHAMWCSVENLTFTLIKREKCAKVNWNCVQSNLVNTVITSIRINGVSVLSDLNLFKKIMRAFFPQGQSKMSVITRCP